MNNNKITTIFNNYIKNSILKTKNINEDIIKIESDDIYNNHISICLTLIVTNKPENEILDNEISLKTVIMEGGDFKV